MNFFDSLIDDVNSIINPLDKKMASFNPSNQWKDLGKNQVVLLRDSAYELDGVGFNLVTSKAVNDEIVVVGKDLNAINANIPFARVAFIQIDDVDDEQKNYDVIRKIEYVKYHYFPDGYMIRTSSRSHKEVVRVSKSACNNGVSFEKIGNLLISKFKENPHVMAVKLMFITDPSVDYKQLEKLARKNNSITETFNHIMNNVNFDCTTCNLKPICDEVEGMKELHFKTSMK